MTDAKIHHLKVAERPPDEKRSDITVKITWTAEGMIVIDADKGIPGHQLSFMSFVFEEFARAHCFRGGV